ncbi:hypothetical protein GQ457_14G001790 [Hibiscus cannabinus]
MMSFWVKLCFKTAAPKQHHFHIPKHSIVAWMAILNRLPTRDRLSSFGMQVETGCVLCGREQETRDHIFFDCVFSRKVWLGILLACQLRRDCMTWELELGWAVARLKGRSLLTVILQLSWNTFIYVIWKERNLRIFQRKFSHEDSLIHSIKDIVSIRLRGKPVSRVSEINSRLCIEWRLV